ncbi:hypothetical protein ACFW04_000363 [Cataglyphis niger]
MENEYTVTVTNKFLLALDESEDPFEVLKVRELEKEAKKKERISEKQQQQQQQQQDDQKQPSANNKTPKSRVMKDAQQQPPTKTTNGGDCNIKFSNPERSAITDVIAKEKNRKGKESSGEVGVVGPRGRVGFDNRGKREFDRQSGSDKTDIKPVDKKHGAGSHNWGTHNDKIEESLNQETQEWNNEKPESEPQAATEVKNGDTTPDATVEEKPAEEETRELTLDEWKALRSNRAKPQYNLRKAGEGEDLSRWKKMYALEKKKEGNEEEDNEEEEYDAAAKYPQRVGRQKRVLGIEIQFSDSRRGSGNRGRGDRINGRGFGNRGAPRDSDSRPQNEQRSPRSRQNAPKVDDENDFPSLG